jgi:hypothetical protein
MFKNGALTRGFLSMAVISSFNGATDGGLNGGVNNIIPGDSIYLAIFL